MKRAIGKKWDSYRKEVADRCEKLAAKFGRGKTAVALRDIAEQCGVKRVVFRPLLVDGGLAFQDDGFVVFVRCDSCEARKFEREFYDNFGYNLSGRMRFTIAHELVHTLFYERTDKCPLPKVATRSSKELESLEHVCDFGANRLLLPAARFDELLRTNFLSAARIFKLAREFRVSPATLVIRLGYAVSWNDERGCAAVVTRQNGHFHIDAISFDTSSTGLFAGAKRGGDLASIISKDELDRVRRSSSPVVTNLVCRVGKRPATIRAILEARVIANNCQRFILTASLEGMPQFLK